MDSEIHVCRRLRVRLARGESSLLARSQHIFAAELGLCKPVPGREPPGVTLFIRIYYVMCIINRPTTPCLVPTIFPLSCSPKTSKARGALLTADILSLARLPRIDSMRNVREPIAHKYPPRTQNSVIGKIGGASGRDACLALGAFFFGPPLPLSLIQLNFGRRPIAWIPSVSKRPGM